MHRSVLISDIPYSTKYVKTCKAQPLLYDRRVYPQTEKITMSTPRQTLDLTINIDGIGNFPCENDQDSSSTCSIYTCFLVPLPNRMKK